MGAACSSATTAQARSSIFEVLAAIQDMVVWNKDAAEVFDYDDLTKPVESKEQRIEIDIDSEWGMFRYELHIRFHRADLSWRP